MIHWIEQKKNKRLEKQFSIRGKFGGWCLKVTSHKIYCKFFKAHSMNCVAQLFLSSSCAFKNFLKTSTKILHVTKPTHFPSQNISMLTNTQKSHRALIVTHNQKDFLFFCAMKTTRDRIFFSLIAFRYSQACPKSLWRS